MFARPITGQIFASTHYCFTLLQLFSLPLQHLFCLTVFSFSFFFNILSLFDFLSPSHFLFVSFLLFSQEMLFKTGDYLGKRGKTKFFLVLLLPFLPHLFFSIIFHYIFDLSYYYYCELDLIWFLPFVFFFVVVS